MGMTPAKKTTFPALAKRLCFVTPDQAIPVGEAVVKVQRDFGNRSDRKQARLKYLLHDRGLDWFRDKVAEYYGKPLTDLHPTDVTDVDDHIGWHEQGDGKLFLGINIENGRIKDEGPLRLKTMMRTSADEVRDGHPADRSAGDHPLQCRSQGPAGHQQDPGRSRLQAGARADAGPAVFDRLARLIRRAVWQ